MNLADAFEAIAEADPQRVAVLVDDQVLTRGDLRAAIAATVRLLRDDWAVGRDDRVAYLGVNRVEELVLLFALARIGAVFVPLNTRLAVTELVGIATHAGLHTLVCDSVHHDICQAVVDGIGVAAAIRLRSIGEVTLRSTREVQPGVETVAPDAPVLLVYTAGTTGTPKGVLHTQAGLLANARASIAVHEMTADDRVLTALPLFHVGGLCIQTLPALLCGASVVLHPRFEAKAWLDAVATMRPTLALMVPATLRAVILHRDWASTNLSCLRVLMTGSSTIPRLLIDAVHARNVPVGQIYGSTETGPVTVALGAGDARRKPGYAGWPCFEDSVRLADEHGAAVARDAVGEIVVRAPNVMRGYWREPPHTGFRDGWFATGDLGRFDDEGCLEVVGRTRDLIITGGENVYPAEIEDLLLAIAGVADVAVVGASDERWGEVPVAFVVRGNSAAGLLLDEQAVVDALADRVARFKLPKRVVFVDQLPRNAMGKVQRQVLQDRLSAPDAPM